MLTRKTTVLAKIESSYNVDPTPTAADALLISDPNYSLDLNVLERDNFRSDLSPSGIVVGRKLAGISFTTELRTNGLVNSGLTANAAKMGRLLRGCGFSETGHTGGGGANLMAMKEITAATQGQVSWGTAAGTYADANLANYTIEVTLAGASGIAQVSITPDAQTLADSLDAAQAAVVITTTVALPLTTAGGGEISIVPTWTGTLVLGDKWRIVVVPDGLTYEPVSSSFESLTFYIYMDGVRHIITGCYGTFSINATAGEFGTVEWEFTGQYVAATDNAAPANLVFETTSPPIVELAKLRLDSFSATVNALTYDQNNEITPRPSVNAADGYNGVNLTARAPEGGLDPEAVLVASEDFWGKMAASTDFQLTMRAGKTVGEVIWLYGPKLQYNALSYADRDGTRTYDAGVRFSRFTGNDEALIVMA